MANQDAYKEEIIHYLFDDMTEQEKADFEQRMEKDEELAAEVERQRRIMKDLSGMIAYKEAMEDPHLAEAKEIAQEILDNAGGVKTGSKSSYRPVRHSPVKRVIHFLAVAAMLAILIVSSVLLSNHPNAGRLYADFYNPFTVDESGISTTTSTGAIIAQCIFNYNHGRYQQAIAALTELKNQNELDELPPESTFTLGLAYLAVNDLSNAQSTFEDHLNHYDAYENETSWYLGLTYLKKGETQEAREILGKVAASDSAFAKQARSLNRRLDKMLDT